MQFFASAVTTLQTLVVALGAGLAVWGVVNLLGAMARITQRPKARASSSSWLIKGNKKKGKTNPDGISGRLQE